MSKYIDIPKHLQSLLYEYSPVIIPGIGALNTSYKAAQLDEAKGIITPPIKTVELNDRMRGNDGLLSSHIARAEKISEADADVEIKLFADLLLHRIETNGKAIIEGIGEFYRDITGGLGFLPDPKANFSADTYGLQSINIGDAVEVLSPPLVPQESTAGVGTFSVIEEPIADTEKPHTLADLLGSNHEIDTEIATSGNILGGETSSSRSLGAALAGDDSNSNTPKKRGSNRWVMWLLPLLILLLFFGLLSRLSSGEKGLFGGLFSSKKTNTDYRNNETTTATDNTLATTDGNADSNTIETMETTTQATDNYHSGNETAANNNNATQSGGTTTTPDGLHTIIDGITITNSQANEYINTNAPKGYYIVVGAWKNRAKANEIAQIFKQQQYNVQLLETNSGTVRIGLYSEQTIPQIKAEYARIREGNPDVWVLHYQ